MTRPTRPPSFNPRTRAPRRQLVLLGVLVLSTVLVFAELALRFDP